MRILHVWDQAAVSGVLAKYQRKLGNEVEVVIRVGYDGLGQQQFYGDHFIGPIRRGFKKFGPLRKPLKLTWRTCSVLYFYLYVMVHARRFDVVHIHSQYLTSLLLPFKPKIIEFHGDDIRDVPCKRWWIDRCVTSFFLWVNQRRTFYVSTPDMLRLLKHGVYIPNPVDTEFFCRTKPCTPGFAVYFHNWHEDGYDRAVEIAKKFGWDLEIVDRTLVNRPIPYKDIVAFMETKEFMIDRVNIHSLSKTALEALAMGIKVVDYRNVIVEGLPSQHDPFVVAKKTLRIYEDVIKK